MASAAPVRLLWAGELLLLHSVDLVMWLAVELELRVGEVRPIMVYMQLYLMLSSDAKVEYLRWHVKLDAQPDHAAVITDHQVGRILFLNTMPLVLYSQELALFIVIPLHWAVLVSVWVNDLDLRPHDIIRVFEVTEVPELLGVLHAREDTFERLARLAQSHADVRDLDDRTCHVLDDEVAHLLSRIVTIGQVQVFNREADVDWASRRH